MLSKQASKILKIGEALTAKALKHTSSQVGVLSVPFNKGQPKGGVERGPALLKSTGFIENLREIGVNVKDYGEVDFAGIDNGEPLNHPLLKNISSVGLGNKKISDAVAKVLRDQRFCLNLGGDHSMGIGTVHGASEVYGEDLSVVWVDAHADINTPSTSWSGNFHGMPCSFWIKELQPYVAKLAPFNWVTPRISAKNVIFVGLRDVDAYERKIIDLLGIKAYSMKEVSSLGIEKVMEMVLDQVCGRQNRPFHLSYDIDALDDLEARSTGTPVPGGLTLREGLTVVETLRNSGNMVSMDLVEVNPLIGTEADVDRTVKAARQIILHAFGYYRGGIAVEDVKLPLAIN